MYISDFLQEIKTKKNMHFLMNDDPETVMPVVGVAVFSLVFLFSITLTGAGFRDVAESMGPAENVLATAGQGMIAAWQGTEEAVYATAVYTGMIPFEESSYYAVALPFHQAGLEPQVASATANNQELQPVQVQPEVVEDTVDTPWEALYRFFSGK